MFLYYLNPQEGECFLELATIAAQVNGTTDENEELGLDSYRYELNLHDYIIKHMPYDRCVAIIKSSNTMAKRSMLIELATILYADKEIDSKEQNWIMKLSTDIGLEKDEAERLISWSKDFADFIEVGLMYINCKND